MTNWDEKEKKRYSQSGKGPGEFGSPYQYTRGSNESPSPFLRKYLDSRPKKKIDPFKPHVLEPHEYDLERKIKRDEGISLEEIKWRHKMMRERMKSDE